MHVAPPLQLTRSQSSWKSGTGGSFRSSFQEEAWKRYNRRMQEEYEEEMERVVRLPSVLTLYFIPLFVALGGWELVE